MPHNKNILLVEGKSDQAFFEALRDRLGLKALIQVAPPKDVGGSFNSKEGLLNYLPTLLALFPNGSLQRLAIVLDADYVENSALGFAKTFARVESHLIDSGFAINKPTPQQQGFTFRHSEGFADVGVWVMPNNRDDGILEDLLHTCVRDSEQQLFQHAKTTVGRLATPRFRPFHTRKAELATWLAWQQNPGRGVDHAVHDELFDLDFLTFRGLIEWLRRVFR
jgi:hypothetical protein